MYRLYSIVLRSKISSNPGINPTPGTNLSMMLAALSNGDKEHETININLSNKPIWISDLNVDRKVPILEFIKDGEIKVWFKYTTTIR